MPEPVHCVLIADEDRFVLQLIHRILTEDGFAVESCQDGREALRIARRGTHDVILLSTSLPRRSGAEVVQDLRAEGGSVPAILLTGMFDLVPKASMKGVLHLSKPFMLSELRATISRALALEKD